MLPFGINNAPSEFQKCMEDICREKQWELVFIDDILVCSKNLQEHLKHLQMFYDLVFKHGLVLSQNKMEIKKTKMVKEILKRIHKEKKGKWKEKRHHCSKVVNEVLVASPK